MNTKERQAEALRIANSLLLDVSNDRIAEALDYDATDEDADIIYGMVRSAAVQIIWNGE